MRPQRNFRTNELRVVLNRTMPTNSNDSNHTCGKDIPMEPKSRLDQLLDDARRMRRTMRRLEREMTQAAHYISIGRNTARSIEFLLKRQLQQLRLMYDVGRIDAQIDDYRSRGIQALRDQVHVSPENEYPDDHKDYLVWMRPELEASTAAKPEQSHDREMTREAGDIRSYQRPDRKEDYPDWLR